MKIFIALIMFGLGTCVPAFAYEGPSPLTGIRITEATTRSLSGIYQYSYKVMNPPSNDGEIISIDLSIDTNRLIDAPLANSGFAQCSHYSRHTSENNFRQFPMVPVGSGAPKGWSCGYGRRAGSSSGSFGWGAIDDPYVIKPGSSLSGLTLTSAGLPGIRSALVEPNIDLDRLPSDYTKDPNLLPVLEDKVKWTGQTVGPKAPPKVFAAGDFIGYLITLVNQSRAQGWIDNDGIANSLLAKLKAAAAKATSDAKTSKKILGGFLNDVRAQNGKHLSSEAYALLYFNGQYAVSHM